MNTKTNILQNQYMSLTGTPNIETNVVLMAKYVFEKTCSQILFKW